MARLLAYPAAIFPASQEPRMLLTATSGRLILSLRLHAMGKDIQAILTGGDAHTGGTALAAPNFPVQTLSLPGHRDAELACRLAQGLADGLGCTTCVTAGIHYENITRDEIEECRRLADTLLHSALERLRASASDNNSQGICHADSQGS